MSDDRPPDTLGAADLYVDYLETDRDLVDAILAARLDGVSRIVTAPVLKLVAVAIAHDVDHPPTGRIGPQCTLQRVAERSTGDVALCRRAIDRLIRLGVLQLVDAAPVARLDSYRVDVDVLRSLAAP